MESVRLAMWGCGLLVVGTAALLTGILPAAEALTIADRVWPILAFVVAMTVVAGLATEAGVFDVIASALARAARGRTWALWLLLVLLAVATTAFLSLDTTAVLLTPVVVVVARACGLPPLPFAIATVWLANTASLALPVSNLTNLLSLHVLGFTDALSWVKLFGPSALVAAVVPAFIAVVIHRQSLPARFVARTRARVADRTLLAVSAVVLGMLLPCLVAGVPPWIPTTGAAVLLAAVFAWRAPRALTFALIPWQLVVFVAGLFLTVGALQALGSGAVIAAITGTGEDLPALLRLAASGLVGSNAINNLPAYLALEPAAGTPPRIAALLVGVNAGSIVLPWGSLATLLWHDRLVSLGVDVRWGRFILLGCVVAPVTVLLATLALALTAG